MRRAGRARRSDFPAARAGLAVELGELRAQLTDCPVALLCLTDGAVIAADHADTGPFDPLHVAAGAADLVGQSRRTGLALGSGGDFLDVMSRTTQGIVAVYRAGPYGLLVIVATPDQNVGLMQHHGRRVAGRIADLLSARADRP